MARHIEDDLQIATADLCRAVLHPSVIFHHSVNEGKRGKAAAGIAKAMGQLAGFADWMFVWLPAGSNSGIPLVGFIELKTDKGVLSDTQKEFRARVTAVGCDWALCRTVDEFLAILKLWGVPMRGAKVMA
jgi:hypothetical protein